MTHKKLSKLLHLVSAESYIKGKMDKPLDDKYYDEIEERAKKFLAPLAKLLK